MTKIIIHTNENGGVSITYPAPEFLETHTIEDVKIKDTPEHSIIIDASELPQNQDEFFAAWELNGTAVSVNLTKAKDIAKNKLRTERAPVLATLDVSFMRAVESGNTSLQTAIAGQKQELRDITSHTSITGASDIDSLKTSMTTLIEQIKS